MIPTFEIDSTQFGSNIWLELDNPTRRDQSIYYKEFNKLKKAHNLDTINKFKRFKDTFANNKNIVDCKISNSLRSTNNNSKDLIKINNNRVEIR